MTALVAAQVYFIISWWEGNASKSENIMKNTTEAQNEIKTFQKSADEALAFSKRAELVSPLLDSHVYWTNFFRYLERNTLSSVTFSGFSGDTKGTYILTARARHYSDINWQVKKFLADDYTISAVVGAGNSGGGNPKKVSTPISTSTEESILETASRLAEEKKLKAAGPQEVSFSIELKVNPEVFLAPKTK